MSDVEYVRERIAILRPRAKFAAYSHSSEFIDEAAGLGDGFHYVNLYDEKIDSNVISGPRGLILIHNTYLSSFAYNLFLCWLLSARRSDGDHAVPPLETLLTHNFKKFFAEQLLHAHNSIFSRAIFLETLLFEQACMVPVFEAKSRDADLGRKADIAANLMSSAVSFHELGHYFLRRDPRQWEGVLEQNAGVVETLHRHVSERYPAAFVEEFRCDVMSVVSCLQQYEAEEGREFCVRAIAFAFAAFAVLSSLGKSATRTAREHRAIPEDVDFGSIEKVHRDYEYSLGPDLDFIERAHLVLQLCDNLAQAGGMPLFAESGAFPLPATILNDLLGYIDRIMVSHDSNARSMSMLVAEALHEHPRGLEFLYLRSKTFSFSGETPQSQGKPDS